MEPEDDEALLLEGFTMVELEMASDRIKTDRAPCPDDILPESIKAIVKERGSGFVK